MDDPATDHALSALTQAIAKGDPSAFARFYDEWFDRLVRLARASTRRDEAFCLDVVQDAMIKIMHGMKRFHDRAGFECWLRLIVMRCALDRIRADQRRTAREADHARRRSEPQATVPESESRVRWLEDQLGQLDPGRSLLLTMRFRLGATLERIGRVVGLSPGAVDGRISRSLAQIRAAAQEQFDEP